MNTRKRSKTQTTNDRPSKKQRTIDSMQININNSAVAEKWQSALVIKQLEKALRSKGNATDAASMKKYMRDKFDFYGLKSPLRREVMKEVFAGKDKGLSTKEVKEFAQILWGKPQRELQHIAMEFLEKHKKELCKNETDFEENIEFFKMLVTSKSWWDTVDMLAYKLVGYLVQTHPTKGKPVMQEWISCDDMWLRRTAILHQLCRKESTDENMLFQFCLARCHEKEFFIRKAIGWSLRDYARTKPNKVKKFLQQHKDSLSQLSFNEAAKHLNIAKK
jgi:3-methyladenine DNA glycosylase AlkD